jgi:RNA polymerase-binding transcription factor DksA
MKHIPEDRLEDLQTALKAERAALEEELSTFGKKVGEDDWDASSESEGEEAAPEDAADNIEELATNAALVSDLEKRHKEIKNAMSRLGDGTYGLCDVCGEEIDLDRLDANPAASTCIAHA